MMNTWGGGCELTFLSRFDDSSLLCDRSDIIGRGAKRKN